MQTENLNDKLRNLADATYYAIWNAYSRNMSFVLVTTDPEKNNYCDVIGHINRDDTIKILEESLRRLKKLD